MTKFKRVKTIKSIKSSPPLILKSWSNTYASTVHELKEVGNKIIAVSKSGDYGHIITYKHASLVSRPHKGDLIEYYDDTGSGAPRARNRYKKAVVNATQKDGWCLNDHVGIKNTIIAIGMITKIIKRNDVSLKTMRYMGNKNENRIK